MAVGTDIEIAQNANMLPIKVVAGKLGLGEDDIEQYGKYKAKINLNLLERLKDKPDGKLILVTAITPTPAGEGKSTTTIGLGQALALIGKNAAVALREPSLGPVFGIKGGAAGGGYAQVVPMEDINLHFTGDFHALTSANNLLAAAIDNHINHGNALGIDPRQIVWKRVVDMNDRALRSIVIGLGGKANGFVREDGFMITVASEVMAILCLSQGLTDMKNRLGKIIVGYSYDNQPVTAAQLNIQGAMALLLKDAIKPNLVQTLENTPAFIHGGPFANIAHGCNSILATKMGLKLCDYLVTEAGFGADLGAEKFMDIKCRIAGLKPSAVVLVATVRALKMHGGVAKPNLQLENLDAIARGFANLEKHLENLRSFGVPVVVSINKFYSDTDQEVALVQALCQKLAVPVSLCEVWEKGGAGGTDLAQKVIAAAEQESAFRFLYDEKDSIKEKIRKIAVDIYGSKAIIYTPKAEKEIQRLESLGLDKMPICMAKTQYSFSDNPALLGRPQGFDTTISEVRVSAGAGFIVALTGDIMVMPGLPKVPAAEKMDIDEQGIITGLS